MKPIIFKSRMVKAILDGCKTETRRIIKPQPNSIRTSPFVQSGLEDDHGKKIKIPYKLGDVLWVRETWAEVGGCDPGLIIYKADYPNCVHSKYENVPDISKIKWKPSIFMPKEACRLFLEVISNKAERLHDITEQGARAEGIIDGGCLNCGESEPCGCDNPDPSALDSFIYLWNFINRKRGYDWILNPWVWAVKFKIKEIKNARAA